MTTVAEINVPRGELVLAVLASANRDEQQFEDADRLDLGREPNPHVAFGFGIHYCLGASLARLEGQIAIATLLRRIPNLKTAIPSNALRWRRGLVLPVWRVYQSRLREIPREAWGEGYEELLFDTAGVIQLT